MREREQESKPNILVVDRNNFIPILIQNIFKNEFNAIGFDKVTPETLNLLMNTSTRLIIISFSSLAESTQLLGPTFADTLKNRSNPPKELGSKKQTGVILHTANHREYEVEIAARYLDASYLKKPATINQIKKAVNYQLSKL